MSGKTRAERSDKHEKPVVMNLPIRNGSWSGRLSRSRIPVAHRRIFARILMASYGLPAVVRAGAIFRRDSVRIRLCTAASAVGGTMEP